MSLIFELTDQRWAENFRVTDAAPQRRQEPQDKELADQSNPMLSAGSTCGVFGGGRQFVAKCLLAKHMEEEKETEGKNKTKQKKSHRNYKKNYRYKIDNIYQKAKIKNLE